MDVLFLKKFSKVLDKIKKPKDLQSILEIIVLVKQVQDFVEVIPKGGQLKLSLS